jgi:hypothetical protein
MASVLATTVALVVAVAAASAWVLTDARSRSAAGRPVVVWIGGVVIDQPAAWALLCLLAAVVMLPLCLVARGSR